MADQRINFFNLFKSNQDGSFEPIRVIRIGGVQIGPGVRFGRGVNFAGIDLTQHVGKDFLVDEQQGVFVVKGIF